MIFPSFFADGNVRTIASRTSDGVFTFFGLNALHLIYLKTTLYVSTWPSSWKDMHIG